MNMQRHAVVVVGLVAGLLCAGQARAQAPGSPVIFWARVLDGVVVVHGRNLTSVDVNFSKPTATIDGQPIEWIPDPTSDGPGAYGTVQLYIDRPGALLVVTREDGQKAQTQLHRPQYAAAAWNARGLRVVVDTPIAWPTGTLADCEFVAAAGFEGPVLVVDQPNGAAPVRMRNIKITGPPGQLVKGLEITRCFDACFENLSIVAEQPVYAGPTWKGARNSWVRCDLAAGVIQRGQCNRGILGDECLVAACRWHDIDRGLVCQQAGPPMHASLVAWCTQERTGTTIGGSEGLLWEAPNGWPIGPPAASCNVSGKVLTIKTQSPVTITPGYFAMDVDRKVWARIVGSTVATGSAGLTYTVQLDRDCGTSPPADPMNPVKGWILDNAAVNNSVVHHTAISGKLAVHWFGRSIGNVCDRWDCRGIHDVVVEEACKPRIDPDGSKVYGVAWGNVYPAKSIRMDSGCTRGIHRCEKYYDGNLDPFVQMPWLRYAQ